MFAERRSVSAVPAAGVALAVVAVAALVALAVVLVVGAGGVRVIGQRAGQQRFGLCVTASAPWPLPFVSTTSLEVILPFSTVYSLNCCVWPKCWNTSPFS